jgi:hypothetical protein
MMGSCGINLKKMCICNKLNLLDFYCFTAVLINILFPIYRQDNFFGDIIRHLLRVGLVKQAKKGRMGFMPVITIIKYVTLAGLG